MKKRLILLATALAAVIPILMLSSTAVVMTGCTTVTQGTNVVKVIDPVKLQQAKDAIVPAASSVLRRAILRSPEHAVEIATYSRAVGSVFCRMAKTQTFDPAYLITQLDQATASLQATASPEIIDAKNAAVALYKIFLNDKLMVSIPNNQWQIAICQLFCEAIDQALKDAGQPSY